MKISSRIPLLGYHLLYLFKMLSEEGNCFLSVYWLASSSNRYCHCCCNLRRPVLPKLKPCTEFAAIELPTTINNFPCSNFSPFLFYYKIINLARVWFIETKLGLNDHWFIPSRMLSPNFGLLENDTNSILLHQFRPFHSFSQRNFDGTKQYLSRKIIDKHTCNIKSNKDGESTFDYAQYELSWSIYQQCWRNCITIDLSKEIVNEREWSNCFHSPLQYAQNQKFHPLYCSCFKHKSSLTHLSFLFD